MQGVSSAEQTQAQKGVVLRQTATQAAAQTVTVIQIQTIDFMMFSDQLLIIRRLSVLFQAQTQRQTQITMVIQISTIDEITPPHYHTVMKFNIFFQA